MATSDAEPSAGDAAALVERAEWLKLYELALQEYRFQVLLNWDRAKQMLVVNGALVAAIAAVHRLDSSRDVVMAVLLVFLFVTSMLAFFGTRTSQQYYREARELKSKYERLLGLDVAGLAVVSTRGMKEDHDPKAAPLSTARKWERALGRHTSHLQFLFASTALLAAVAAVFLICDG